MDRRRCLAAAGAVAWGFIGLPLRAQPERAAAPKPRSIVVLDFELVDDQNNPLTKAAQEVRLRNATAQIQRELSERGLYQVLDPAASQALQRSLREQQEYLYRCTGCAEQVGKLVGADLAMTTWVQKVSELILNVNVEVHDVKTEKVLLSKSVDLRGNDDVSWSRAVRFLVRDMAEKRERNPKYGQ